jgi:predicted signal transduction protein with EAL and GGDEF domain
VGIAFSHADDEPIAADDLVRHADAALYRAKAAGKARAVVFDSSMDATALRETAAPDTAPRVTPEALAEPAPLPALAGGA